MQMYTVESSMIAAVGWDDVSGLVVRFKSGNQEYQYSAVPEHVFQELRASASVGKFFKSSIQGKYESIKL